MKAQARDVTPQSAPSRIADAAASRSTRAATSRGGMRGVEAARRARDWLARFRALLDARRLALVGGAVLAAWGFGNAGYVHAKASLAQHLLRHALDRTLVSGEPARPWPWADTWPVARLSVPRLEQDQVVLVGASGRTLAFGPALSTGGAMPGREGLAVVSGHRDTHFAFLRDLVLGDRVWLETAEGRYAYRIDRFDVVDARTAELPTAVDGTKLALVTCYPFDAVVPGGPLRYVASATLVASATSRVSPADADAGVTFLEPVSARLASR